MEFVANKSKQWIKHGENIGSPMKSTRFMKILKRLGWRRAGTAHCDNLDSYYSQAFLQYYILGMACRLTLWIYYILHRKQKTLKLLLSIRILSLSWQQTGKSRIKKKPAKKIRVNLEHGCQVQHHQKGISYVITFLLHLWLLGLSENAMGPGQRRTKMKRRIRRNLEGFRGARGLGEASAGRGGREGQEMFFFLGGGGGVWIENRKRIWEK